MNINCNSVLEDTKQYDDCFFNTIFCDPPYNLGSTWIIRDNGNPVIKQSQDFMNKWNAFGEKEWETFFKESYRILKYGGFCIMFGIDRQLFPMQYYAVNAGFEIQQSLYWYFCSSFPKSADAGKMIDKRLGCEREVIKKEKGCNKHSQRTNDGGIMDRDIDITAPLSDLAKTFDGYKYSVSPFKQTVETIMVFRKPTKHKSVLDDLMAWNDGDEEISPCVINVDGGRVLYDDNNKPIPQLEQGKLKVNSKKTMYDGQSFNKSKTEAIIGGSLDGRYPSQTFMDEESAKAIDKQSGIVKSGDIKPHKQKLNKDKVQLKKSEYHTNTHKGNEGGCSRINHIIKYQDEEKDLFYYSPKVSGKERNNPIKNNHPCLKPIALIQKIFTLFKLPDVCNQKVYVPFSGTFSECIGIFKSGIKEENIYGCELNQEYIDIGQARFEYWRNRTIEEIKKEKIENFSKKHVKKGL